MGPGAAVALAIVILIVVYLLPYIEERPKEEEIPNQINVKQKKIEWALMLTTDS